MYLPIYLFTYKMSIIRFLKENKDCRKLFGKRELSIIEKQLRGINLTQSEKNRLSRDIRKKLLVIKELSKYEQEFALKKGKENKELIQETILRIKETELFPKIKRIVLFGSAIDKELTLMSDIDIAVEFDEIDEEKALKFCSRVGGFSSRLDVQVYNLLPDKIKNQINKKGKIIYKR
mgnify:CR=1 FL=1